MPEWAWPFLVKHGVSTLDCMPYISGNGSVPHHCETTCQNGATPRYYRARNYTHAGDFFNAEKHVAAIQRALLSGPLDATFVVYGDFDNYQAGTVYKHRSGGFEGLHSVKIVGYGVQDGTPYWTVQNSWVSEFDSLYSLRNDRDQTGVTTGSSRLCEDKMNVCSKARFITENRQSNKKT